MIFPVVFILLCARITESSMFVGDPCTLTDNTPGVCGFVFNCKPVLQALLAGITPDKICGYHPDHADPIICCPNKTTSGKTSTEKVDTRAQPEADGRGEIARRKCAEYTKFVYAEKRSPFGDRPIVKLSQCAIKAIPLITGGEKADRMEFPHMAAVGYNKPTGGISWFCGGTLISETYVLSAAHCTHSPELGQAEWVRVGDLDLASNTDGASPETRRIIDRIRHPQYDPPAQYHDIALFRLESRVPFNGWIRPACLHTAPSTGTERAIATGWGKVEWFDEAGSDHLLKVTLSLVDSVTCHGRWGNAPPDYKLPKGPNLDWAMCAGHQGNDTCQGDSGGPLVIFSDKKYYCMYDVVGVTSLGKLCGINFPGIYTRVYHYVSWIESVVWPQG